MLTCFCIVLLSSCGVHLPPQQKILAPLRLANQCFINKWPDAGKSIITNRERPSNIWTRAVYYEGLMALYIIDNQSEYYDYAVSWGEKHKWALRNGIETRNADDQACVIAYELEQTSHEVFDGEIEVDESDPC